MGAEGPGSRDEAAEALSRAFGILRELGLEDEARQVSSLITRLGSESAPVVGPQVFRREGEYWFVLFEGDVFRLRDSKGLRYLATLLGNPGREIHSLHLAGAGTLPAGDAGEVLDPEARRAYRRRLQDLREELEEAEAWSDSERATRARQEMDALMEELTRGEGLGGRARRAGSDAERARVAVTKALKSAVERINQHSPALGRHLASTLRTGTYCRYDPDPRLPVAWKL